MDGNFGTDAADAWEEHEQRRLGIKRIIGDIFFDDSDEEVGSKLENALRSIPGIENVECVSNTVV